MAVHDLPDYTREMVIKYAGGFIGLEELAARLKSIVPWDLRGNVVLLEDFESEPTECILVAVGTNSSAARSSAHKASGDWSVKLVADSEADAGAFVTCSFGPVGSGKIAGFTRVLGLNDIPEVYFYLTAYGGPEPWCGALRYRGLTNEWACLDRNGEWQTFVSDLTYPEYIFTFLTITLVIDLATGYYVKAIIGDIEIDLSAYQTAESTFWYGSQNALSVVNGALDSQGGTIYVDDIVVVKNVL